MAAQARGGGSGRGFPRGEGPGSAGALPRAVLLDALGTLVALEPPAPALRTALRERAGIEIAQADAEKAVRAEIGYYRAHIQDGRDAESLADLRLRCAEAMRAALPEPAASLPAAALVEALLASLRFTPYPDVEPALRALRTRGVRLVVVSNWDVSLLEVLSATGLSDLLDGVVTSAQEGAAKPDQRPFERALAIAAVAPDDAWHAGDDLEADVGGARAAGIAPILVHRSDGAAPRGVRVVRRLTELVAPGAAPGDRLS